MPENQSSNPDDPNQSRTAGDIRTLARAIVHAANMGARVINISVVSCVKVTTPIDQAMLGGALKYATEVKDALVVAAAGNVNSAVDSGAGNQNCKSNPDADPTRPDREGRAFYSAYRSASRRRNASRKWSVGSG